MFFKGKEILVTGASGFVGTHFLQALLRAQAKIRATVHQHPLKIQDRRIKTIRVDLTKEKDCLKAVDGVDMVVHAAGRVGAAGVSSFDIMKAITCNLQMSSLMLQAAWQSKAERFLLFGSSTAYPVTDVPVKEEQMWSGPPHPTYTGYAWFRRYLEMLAEFVAGNSSLKIALVRPTAVYGSFDNFNLKTSHVIPALIRRAVSKEDPFVVWGTGDELRDFLHIDDFVRGSLLTLEKRAACDPVNIGYGKAVSIKALVRLILKESGHKSARVIFDPSKPTMINRRLVDTTKAKRLLGFNPEISLGSGIKDTVAWYRKNYTYYKRER